MRSGKKLIALIIVACLFLLLKSNVFAATDGIYILSETTYSWDGTDASRLNNPTPDYDYSHGDENRITYTLPWPFTFYGQSFTQITVDTNGNVWFGANGNANSFNLPTTGPVISAWNNDLSSLYQGGVFVQHKTNPERVVIEWQAETYSDEGSFSPNIFEVVLSPNGSMRVDYKVFSAINSADFGSGISKNDGSHYLNLTASVAPVYNVAGRSFAITGAPRVLNLVFAGTGNGFITIAPAGTVCNTNCTSTFPSGTQLTLSPAAASYSLFTRWQNGLCAGTGVCLLTLNADTTETALFDYDAAHQVSIGGTATTYYSTIQAAYNAAAHGDVIKLWATTYTESLVCNRPLEVTFQGGYDSGFTSIIGELILNGSLSILDGVVIADGLRIR
ncbi:right-handed parallel beta-helix repeat-containing protein [Geobacter argillaceus]|nr:hypothetical protein [Geobacter argillaceus]